MLICISIQDDIRNNCLWYLPENWKRYKTEKLINILIISWNKSIRDLLQNLFDSIPSLFGKIKWSHHGFFIFTEKQIHSNIFQSFWDNYFLIFLVACLCFTFFKQYYNDNTQWGLVPRLFENPLKSLRLLCRKETGREEWKKGEKEKDMMGR